MLAMGSKAPTDKISFFVAPFLCAVFCFCSLVHGLSTFPNTFSKTYNKLHIGCECLAPVELQHARYILQGLIVPLILIVAFEQSYVIHKRKTAKFCCIGFDRGHRLKAKNFAVEVMSFVLRSSIWIVAGGLAVFNTVLNFNALAAGPSVLRKQQRFTYKSLSKLNNVEEEEKKKRGKKREKKKMNEKTDFSFSFFVADVEFLVNEPQIGDLVEFCFLGVFTLYFGFSLWNYGKNYSMQMTAMPCNR